MSASPIQWAPEPHRTLRECAQAHTGRLIDRWSHYFPIHEHHLAKFVGRPINLLEIGVGHGGSLQLWKAYFGPNAKIYGLDIDPRCKEYEETQISIEIGPQAEVETVGWANLHVVIDDGSHKHKDQCASFTRLWPEIHPGGCYIIEDCHQGYPDVYAPDMLAYAYPWVLVLEKPKRMVIGKPSRPLNQAELEAYGPR